MPQFVLSGIAIGNGWIDPKEQYPGYLDFAYEKKLLTQGTPVGRPVLVWGELTPGRGAGREQAQRLHDRD